MSNQIPDRDFVYNALLPYNYLPMDKNNGSLRLNAANPSWPPRLFPVYTTYSPSNCLKTSSSE